MEAIVEFFKHIESYHRAGILAGGIALFWLIENVKPAANFAYKKWSHAVINFFFTGTTILVNFVLAFLLLEAANLTHKYDLGLLHVLPEMPLWLYTFVGIFLLDFFGAYLAHFTQHKWAPLWRFHIIHHTDVYLDTTSANRHHPGESVIRFLFTVFGVLLLGTPMWMVFLYQSLSVVFSQFNHANISLPRKLENVLNKLFVTPDFHKVHHHMYLPHTDSNYGNIFSTWDYVFGTYMHLAPSQIDFGLDTHPNENDHSTLRNLLIIPFQKKRQPK
ncbi:sterol desaturase family protein [Flavobacterium sp.]|uniref:sterol desaturase family protein n=1 Tax=Flavobacterium sp. TaxID=239 RepID=UPI003B9DB018